MAETKRGGIPLYVWILLGFAVGLGGGLFVNSYVPADAPWLTTLMSAVTRPIGQIFLAALLMLVLPLLFSAIVVGVAEMGDLRALGRVGWRTLLLTVLVSATAVVIGLVMVNAFQPGAGVDRAYAERVIAESAETAGKMVADAPKSVDAAKFFTDLVPNNIFGAASDNTRIISVMVFAILFGIGLVLVRSKATDQLQLTVSGIFEVMMKLIMLVIATAPVAIACLTFNHAAVFGWQLLTKLAAFVGVAVGAMAIHMFIVYPLLVFLLGGRSPVAFFRGIRAPLAMAFSTASSNATLPVSLQAAETELNLPRRIARFVLTVGATANQNGTALFEGVAVLFLAQFFGVPLSIEQQILVMLVCVLGGIGTAGVPAGSIPVVITILVMVGVEPAAIGLILGVDRFLDMCRTTLNVAGDLVIATIVARGEKDIPAQADEPFKPEPAP